jgi:hypothetical protein
MRIMRTATLAITLFLSAVAHSVQAETTPYWLYSYQGLEVVAPGEDGKYALTLAHNIHRLDAAARRLLDWDTGVPLPPTHVYALHHPAFVKLAQPSEIHTGYNLIMTYTALYYVHDGENFALLDALTNEYSGAYYGLAGSILLSEKLRYPRWFATGYTSLVSRAQIKGTKVIVGRADADIPRFLRSRSLQFIPSRTLMNAGPDDPVLRRELMDGKYRAECWMLVHLITIEGKHKAEFSQYLQLINSGVMPADAFAPAFKATTYEDLDKIMRDTIANGVITTLSYDIPDQPDTEQPQQLNAAAAADRIAHLSEVVK